MMAVGCGMIYIGFDVHCSTTATKNWKLILNLNEEVCNMNMATVKRVCVLLSAMTL